MRAQHDDMVPHVPMRTLPVTCINVLCRPTCILTSGLHPRILHKSVALAGQNSEYSGVLLILAARDAKSSDSAVSLWEQTQLMERTIHLINLIQRQS